MRREKLSEDEVNDLIAGLNGWHFENDQIKTERKFPDFAAALAFVNEVGALAEDADHHPDVTFGWGYADIALTTHDGGGVTDVDIALAEKIDRI